LDSLTIDSPVIDDVYTALKESELHSTDLLPYWKVDFLCKIIPGQVQAENAVMLIMHTVEELIMKCKEIEVENEQMVGEDDVNGGNPSILRFLLAIM
jgi:carotenoid epsilon hydroxylase